MTDKIFRTIVITALLMLGYGVLVSYVTNKRVGAPAPKRAKPTIKVIQEQVLGEMDGFFKAANDFSVPVKVRRIQVILEKLPGLYIGTCNENGSFSVAVDKWLTLTSAQKKYVVWHELGHCILRRCHDTNLLANGVPASMMYPTVFSDETEKYYMSHVRSYDYELFHPEGSHHFGDFDESTCTALAKSTQPTAFSAPTSPFKQFIPDMWLIDYRSR